MVEIVIKFPFSCMAPEFKNIVIAPKLSEFVAPQFVDISKHKKYILSTFITNSDLSLVLPNVLRQLIFNFIRTTEGAFDEYVAATKDLEKYLETKHLHVEFYFSALRHFEQTLAQLYEAVNCMNSIASRVGSERQFEKGDRSVLERVFTLHTHIKHANRKFESATVPDEMSFKLFVKKPDGSRIVNCSEADAANISVWLTNIGLECGEVSLTFAELAPEILSFCREAETMATMTPPIGKM